MDTDDLAADVAEMRRLRATAASPLPWGGEIQGAFDRAHHSPVYVHAADGTVPVYCYGGGKIQRLKYVVAAANLAPRLADALDAMRAENERLREALDWLTRIGQDPAHMAPHLCGLPDRWERLVDTLVNVAAAALEGRDDG